MGGLVGVKLELGNWYETLCRNSTVDFNGFYNYALHIRMPPIVEIGYLEINVIGEK